MKNSIFISLLYISLTFASGIFAMEPNGHQYELDVLKHADVSDSFKIKISKTDQSGHKKSGSFIANFATHTCDDQKNLFAPFDIPMRFGDAADADSFLWDVPDFGFLKLHHDGSTFFGHSSHEIPLAADALTFHTSGELFLQTLRVAALHLGSKKTHLCEMLVADAISTEDQVFNSGSLQTSRLLGGGTFCNEGRIEFKGNQHDPALLGIKEFHNKSNPHCTPTVSASHLTVRKDNQKIVNEKDTLFEVSDKFFIEQPLGIVPFHNEGVCKMQVGNLQRHIINEGFFQANTLTAQSIMNKEFGQFKILDCINVGNLDNEGEIDIKQSISVQKGKNRGSITGSPDLTVRVRSDLKNYGNIRLQQLIGGGRFLNRKSLLFNDNASITIENLTNYGLLKAVSASLIHTKLSNTVTGIVELFGKSRIGNTTILNTGEVTIQGDTDITSANISNKGKMALRSGNLAYNNSTLSNEGDWLFEEIKSPDPIGMTTNGTLELANSSLSFDYLHNQRSFVSLTNYKGLILHSGTYKVKDFRNAKMQLGGRDWVITDNPAEQAKNTLLLTKLFPYTNVGEIEAEHDLLYDLSVMPNSVKAEDIVLPNKRMQTVDQLEKLTTSKKVTAWCEPAAIANGDILFPKIGHLELHVNGPLTKYGKLTAPILSLHVNGPFTGGKSNTELATIAATHGPLKVNAHNIDGSFTKFYGKGKTDIEATKGGIVIGAPAWGVDENIKQLFRSGYLNSYAKLYHCNWTPQFLNDCLSIYNYSLYLRNGAYAASDDFLTLRAATKLSVYYGTLFSALGAHLAAPAEVTNWAGKVSSHGPITIQSDLYTHAQPLGYLTKPSVTPGTNAYIEYPGSTGATLESLQRISFNTKKIHNCASSIRSGESIILNGKDALTPATGYVETPQHFYWRGVGGWANILLFSQPCILQSGKNIQMNLGDFVVTGNWNAPGVINILGRAGLFSNGGKLTRETTNATGPIVVDVTQYMQDEARRPGFYRIAENGAIETEFPFGVPSAPQPGDMVVLENPHYPTPPNWRDIFNPLGNNPLNRNLDLNGILMNALSRFANATYARNARGNQSAAVLWSNANRWRTRSGREIMSQADLQQADESMLLSQIVPIGLTPQQRTLLCIVPEDVNRHKDAIVAGEFRAVTQGNQVHLNDQIIAQGPGGIRVESQTGDVTLATQSHTVEYGDSDGAWVTEQRAYPQQQFIAEAGPVDVTAHHDLTRIGTAIVAGTTVHEQAQTGTLRKQELALQKIVEKTDIDDGLFSSKTTITTNVSHQILPSTTIAGTHLHDQAADSIRAVATQDVAGQSITYESPNTVIEGIILADRTTVQSHSSSSFSEQSSTDMKETPCAMAATIRAPQVHLIGDQARINANITAHELHDNTRDGAQFVANVKEMLYHQQTLVDSPLMSLDAGCKGGYETMIQPMLMVDRIIRVSPIGQMLFQSAVIDKDRTAIIGRFVETTYQLKKWHEEWCHKDQLVSDEMLVAIAIAITIATDGMGAELLAITAENAAIAAMVNAGFTTLCATAGTAILRTGDPLQVMEQIASPQFLKSFAIDVASAGLCEKLGSALKIPMGPGTKSLMGHVQSQAVKTTVDTLLNVAVNDAPVGKSLGNAAAQISLKAVAGYAANNICAAHLDKVGQKVAHTVLGGAIGFAESGNSRGLASGAVGALTAETVGALLTADAFAVSDAAIGRLKKDGQPLTQENIQKAVEKEVAYRMKIAKVASVTVAAIAKLNPSIASQTAANALDNDIAIRAQIYALSEMQSLLTAASRAVVNLTIQPVSVSNSVRLSPEQSEQSEQPVQESKTAGKKRRKHDGALAKTRRKPVSVSNSVRLTAEEESNIVHNLVLNTIGRQPEVALAETGDLIMQCADEWRPHNYAKTKRSLADRIINPEKSPFIKETSEIIRAAFDHAINETINTYSWIPNPVGLACFAAETGRDIYQEQTTAGKVLFDAALGYGALKGIQLTGRGIKYLYQGGKNLTNRLLYRLPQRRYTPEGRVPFVENPNAGAWKSSEMSMSGDLILREFGHYENARKIINRNPKAPFNVVAEGNFESVKVTKKGIQGLSRKNRFILEQDGKIYLTAKELAPVIRAHPEYKGQDINLMACFTGSDCDGIGQQLAKEMRVAVSAFDGSILGKANGSRFGVFIGNKYGDIITFYPEAKSHTARLLPLIALPALLLSSSEPSKAQPIDTYGDLIRKYEYEKTKEKEQSRSLADRIINPEMSPFIKETSKIIHTAVNRTIDTYAMIPNPVGAACFATEVGRNLYQEKTTAGEVLFNAALGYGGLKVIQKIGRGMYQGGKRIVKGTPEVYVPLEDSIVGSSNAMAPDTVLNKLYQGKHAAEGRVSFVDDPLAGTWSGGTISGDLVLGSDAFCTAYEQSTRYGFQIDPAAPFNVVAHGNSLLMALETKNIHSKALSQANLRVLEENGEVLFTPVQLARAIYTAPGYKKGQPIHLFSCATGAVANGFAQKLSTRMGVNVSAFTENVYNFNDKPLFNVYCEATGKIGVVKTFYPQSGVSKAVASSLLLAGCSEENSSSSSSSEQIERAGAQPMINHTDTHPVKTYNDLMKEYVQQKPFVDDPKRGWWPKACISSNLILLNKNEKSINMNISKSWDRDARCPFNVTAHGGRFHVQIDTQDIHSDGLSTAYKDVLKIQGNVNLNAQELAHLIRTAPGYKEGQNVNLYACNCGAHPNGIAQQLADELRVTVTAFPDRVSGFYNQQLDTSYFISVSKDDDSHFKEIKTFYPRDPGQSRISNIPDRFGEHFN